MKILLVYYHFEVCGGRYYLDAFKRLGHDVRHIGQQMSVKDAWRLDKPVGVKYAHKPDTGFNAFGSDAFQTHWPDWEPDLVLVCDSMVAADNFEHIAYNYVPHAVIAIDNHVRNYDGDWAHQFLAHYHGPAYPVDNKRKDHTWLPCASDPMFTPSPIPWNEREYDVCCVGVMYPRRQELIQAMRDAGLKVFAETGLLYNEYWATYWNSRISLCVSAARDVAQRIFETGRMGCAVLTDPLLDIMDENTYHKLQLRGYAVYWSPAEAVTIAQQMLVGTPAFEVAAHTENVLPEKMRETPVTMGMGASASMAESCWPHTWDARAQVIVDWFEREYGKDKGVADIQIPSEAVRVATEADVEAMRHPHAELVGAPTVHVIPSPRRPFLNLGCGRTHLPGERPAHHALVPEAIYTGEQWVNVDRVANVGADQVFDLFAYPWPLESDSYDGALLSHLCEHIPHEINVIFIPPYDWDERFNWLQRVAQLEHLQDGWFAFFAELYRVLRNGAEVHILSPHARSDGAISDPTHTRYLLPDSFSHSMQPNPDAPFEYSTGGIYFEMVDQKVGVTGDYNHMLPLTTDPADVQQAKHLQLEHLARTQYNVVPEFYVRLRVVK